MEPRRAAAALVLSVTAVMASLAAPAVAQEAEPPAAQAFSNDGMGHVPHGQDAGTSHEPARGAATPGTAGRAAAAVPDGTYHPLDSVRLLDTRSGVGASTMLWPRGAISLQVGGRGGVPSAGVSAVVMNVTAVGPTSGTWITAWPNGAASEPATSNLNVYPGENRANLVTVAVGAGGKVNFRNANGHTHLLADVVGYYSDASGSIGGGYHPEPVPFRAFDSREEGPPWRAGQAYDVVTISPGMDPRVDAVAVNITAVSDGNGFLTAWGSWDGVPNASTVNYTAGRATPNLAVVPVIFNDRGYPMIAVYASGGNTHVVIDVVGWYDYEAAADSYSFTAVTPTRAFDTRAGFGPIISGAPLDVRIDQVAPGAVAVVANITGAGPTAHTWLGVSSDYLQQPGASSVNLVPGEVRPNLTVAPVAEVDPVFWVHNAAGRTHVIADVFGYFH